MKPKLKDAYILDDFAPFVALLKQQLADCDEFDRIASFKNEEELILALKSSEDFKVPFLFIEYYLFNKNLSTLFNSLKFFTKRAKIIYLSTFTYPSQINDLLKFKPDGIVHKADKLHDIKTCIKTLNEDKVFYSGTIVQLLKEEQKAKLNRVFTPREKELLNFWARGYSVEKTAIALNLSFHTVVAHRRNIFKKANCKTLSELLIYVKKKNLIQ
jgi:DNA-binding NarL/FixJ family response regulator